MTSGQKEFRQRCLPLTFLLMSTLLKLISGQITMVPEVTINEGTLRGITKNSRDGKKFFSFEGIRYVEIPERFKVSEPKKPWEGVMDATQPGECCPQVLPSIGSLMGMKGSEDCLFLNVYTPHMNEDTLLPATEHGPQYFMDEEIILVTFNYRLASLGFLYTENDATPGNLGMKDQVLALKWVQKNIHHFGGDKNQVTIYGESAGSVSVHLHMLSRMSHGLFQKAIAQSGVGNNPWAITQHPKWNAERLAALVNCPTQGTSHAMMECLKKVDINELADAQASEYWGPVLNYHWAPAVECVVPGTNLSDYFMTEHPVDLVAQKKITSKVPLMIGIMKNEGVSIFSGLILHEDQLVQEMNHNWSFIAPVAFIYFDRLIQSARVDRISAKIRNFYFGHLDVGLATEQRLTDAFSDRYFVHGITKAAHAQAAHAPVYPFIFTFYDGFSFLHMLGYNHYDPPTHGDDLPYFFSHALKPSLETQEELRFSRNIVKLFSSFAKTGKPEATWGSAKVWPTLGPNDTSITWYKLDKNTQLVGDPFHNRMKFWDHLMDNELKGQYKRK